MMISLDIATEQRFKRELDRGRFANANELIAHAIDLLEAEELEEISDVDMQDWLSLNGDSIKADLNESYVAKARGDFFTPEEAQQILARRRAAREHHVA